MAIKLDQHEKKCVAFHCKGKLQPTPKGTPKAPAKPKGTPKAPPKGGTPKEKAKSKAKAENKKKTAAEKSEDDRRANAAIAAAMECGVESFGLTATDAVKNQMTPDGTQALCWNCQKPGHFRHECTAPPKEYQLKGAKGKDGGGKGGGRGRGKGKGKGEKKGGGAGAGRGTQSG